MLLKSISFRARCGNLSCLFQTVDTISVNAGAGFLPTYGPSFIHLYGKSTDEKYCSCTGKCSTMRPIYRGRVLLSLKTEIDDPDGSTSTGVETEPTAPIIEVYNTTNDEQPHYFDMRCFTKVCDFYPIRSVLH